MPDTEISKAKQDGIADEGVAFHKIEIEDNLIPKIMIILLKINFLLQRKTRLSTFSIDVDEASYSNVRRYCKTDYSSSRCSTDRGNDQLF